MNVFTFTGNLGRDAEVRATQSGSYILSFSVAVKAGWGDNAKTTWVRCSKFGRKDLNGADVEKLKGFLGKGALVCVTGELSTHEWTNRSGETKFEVDVKVNELTLLDSKPQEDKPQAPQQAPEQSFGEGGFDDSDVPFAPYGKGYENLL